MSNYCIHFSPTGGTKKVAGILTSALGGVWREIDLCAETKAMALTETDVVAAVAQRLEPMLGGHKENHLYL